MRYALLIYGEEGTWAAASDDDRRAIYQQHVDYGTWLTEQGWLRGGDELAGSSSATCVRVEDGRVVATDGPFAETKEQLGGFYLIECDDLDQAIEAASRVPTSTRGTVEVRPISTAADAGREREEHRMSKHVLVIWTDGEAWAQMSQEEQQGLFMEYFQYTQWLIDKGWLVAGDPLKPEAKTVRVRDGETQVTDGPYAETKEFLGGFYEIDCTEDQALEAAAKIPDSRFGAIQVQEVMEIQPPPGVELPGPRPS